jgi:hypothetical protein
LIVDFGPNDQPFVSVTKPIQVARGIVTDYYRLTGPSTTVCQVLLVSLEPRHDGGRSGRLCQAGGGWPDRGVSRGLFLAPAARTNHNGLLPWLASDP